MPENKYGIAALEVLISKLDFPISKQEIIDRFGNEMVEVVEGHPVRLWMLLANCPEKRFESREDFLTCDAIVEAVRTEQEETA